MIIRKGRISEINEMMDVVYKAQCFMIKNGNPNQWGYSHPSKELIIEDIIKGINYVIEDNGEIHAICALIEGEDPTYGYIEGGNWLNDEKYITIHRIASDGERHGIMKFVTEYCLKENINIRIDTHEDNKVMRKALLNLGYKECGIIYLLNGEKRIAYQKKQEDKEG